MAHIVNYHTIYQSFGYPDVIPGVIAHVAQKFMRASGAQRNLYPPWIYCEMFITELYAYTHETITSRPVRDPGRVYVEVDQTIRDPYVPLNADLANELMRPYFPGGIVISMLPVT